jgi:hypothetical protein
MARMDFSELFKFNEFYDSLKKILTLKFEVPQAVDLWNCMDPESVSDITEEIDNQLLLDMDKFFNEGRFIELFVYSWPDELENSDVHDEFLDAYESYSPKKKSTDLLGTWVYRRNNRLITMEWKVSECCCEVMDNCEWVVLEIDPIRSLVKDWYVYS